MPEDSQLNQFLELMSQSMLLGGQDRWEQAEQALRHFLNSHEAIKSFELQRRLFCGLNDPLPPPGTSRLKDLPRLVDSYFTWCDMASAAEDLFATVNMNGDKITGANAELFMDFWEVLCFYQHHGRVPPWGELRPEVQELPVDHGAIEAVLGGATDRLPDCFTWGDSREGACFWFEQTFQEQLSSAAIKALERYRESPVAK
jgi:hypothetical protein